MRKVLSKIARKSPEESDAAGTALGHIDYLLSPIPEADQARATYAAAKRAETIHDAMARAELNAATSGSGQNLDNTTRAAFKSILLDKKAQRGFTPDELGQMAVIARGGAVGNISRWLGSLLAPHGVTGMLVGGVELGPKGVLIGAGLPVAGSALNFWARRSPGPRSPSSTR